MSNCKEISLHDELLQSCKIVSVRKGYVNLKEDNLKKILDHYWDSCKKSGAISISFLAVIGEKGSGKSLFTNFLIQYLRSGCHEGWWTAMKTLNDGGKPMGPGFSWGNVTNANLFNPEGHLASTSGVYLWPEPFLMNKNNGDKLLVWVLHMHVIENAEEDMKELEKFLVLVCSRLMEIHVDSSVDDYYRILDHYWNILNAQNDTHPNSLTAKQVCNSIVYVFRSPTKIPPTARMTDDQAKGELLARGQHCDKTPFDKAMLDHFEHINICWMNECFEMLHSDKGIFYPEAIKGFSKIFKEIVHTMMNESEFVEKKTNSGQGLTLEEMHNFLVTTANRINSGKNVSNQVKSILGSSSQNEKTETSSVTTESPSKNTCSSPPTEQDKPVSASIHPVNPITTEEKMDVDDTVVEEAAEQMEIAIDASVANEETEKSEEDAKTAELERSKREEEEKEAQRCRDQKARAVMEKRVSTAVSQSREMLIRLVDQWIKSKLTLSTIDELLKIYSSLLKAILKKHICHIDTSLRVEFKEQVDARCHDESMLYLLNLKEAVTKLKDNIQNQYRRFGFFSSEELDQVVNQELEKLKEGTEEHLHNMITKAANKLLNIYRDHNMKVTDLERNLYREVGCRAIVVYQEKMGEYMKYVPYLPSELLDIHARLKKMVVNLVNDAFHLSHGDAEKMIKTELIAILSDDLENMFSGYKETNTRTLKNLLAIATKIISNAKMEYNRKTGRLLDDHPDGLDENAMNSSNDIIKAQVINILEKRIRSEVRLQEPLEEHKKELENYMSYYWPEVEAENIKNLEGRLAKEKANLYEQQQTMKKEMERNQEQEAKRQVEENVTCNSGSQTNSKFQTTELKPMQTSTPVRSVQSSPLIFHLKSTQILMAVEIDGRFQLQKNELGETETPACLAIQPHTNQLVYGTEALTLFLSDSVGADADTFWSLADCFLAGDLTWSELVSIEGTDYRITLEFLLAFLLKKLKLAVETQINGQFSTAIVVVPNWLTSPQRIQVKNAFDLAGFSDSYLINESSAAVYSTMPSQTSRAGKILVISENLDRVDVCLYRYKGYKRIFEMLEHTTNYTNDVMERKNQDGFHKSFSSGVKKIIAGCRALIDFFWGEQQDKHDQDNSKSRVRDACGRAVKNANIVKSEPFGYIIVCGNAQRWQNTIRSVAKEFWNTSYSIPDEFAVMRGAAVLSRSPKDIGRSIRYRPAFDLERRCGIERKALEIRKRWLPEGIKAEKNVLPMGASEVTYFQNAVVSFNEVGSLVADQFPSNCCLEVTLEISNEGIIRYKEAMSVAVDRRLVKKRVDPSKVRWTTQNSSPEDLATLKSDLEKLITSSHQVKLPSSPNENSTPKVDNEIKTKLLQKCEKMIDCINNGQINISSTFLRKQVLKQLETAKSIALQTNPSPEVVQVNEENVEELSQKYGVDGK